MFSSVALDLYWFEPLNAIILLLVGLGFPAKAGTLRGRKCPKHAPIYASNVKTKTVPQENLGSS